MDELKWREIGLWRALNTVDYEKRDRMSREYAEKVFERTRENQRRKFDKWTGSSNAKSFSEGTLPKRNEVK